MEPSKDVVKPQTPPADSDAPTGLYGAWKRLPHPVRWLGVVIAGLTLIIVGIVLLVLPGPGLLLIAAGVAVLASEFAWANHVLNKGKEVAIPVWERIRQIFQRKPKGS